MGQQALPVGGLLDATWPPMGLHIFPLSPNDDPRKRFLVVVRGCQKKLIFSLGFGGGGSRGVGWMAQNSLAVTLTGQNKDCTKG